MRSECGILFKFFPLGDNLFVLLPANLLLLLLLILQLLHHKLIVLPLRQHSRRLLSFLRVSATRLSSGSDLRAPTHLTSRRCFLRHTATTTQALTYLIDWASCRHNVTGLVSKPASRDRLNCLRHLVAIAVGGAPPNIHVASSIIGSSQHHLLLSVAEAAEPIDTEA